MIERFPRVAEGESSGSWWLIVGEWGGREGRRSMLLQERESGREGDELLQMTSK